MKDENITISSAISLISDHRLRSTLENKFHNLGYIAKQHKCTHIKRYDFLELIDVILNGVVDIMRNDPTVLYVEVADTLYDIFYRNPIFCGVHRHQEINIYLRRYFIDNVLVNQIPELIMLFLQEGLLPQFYSSVVINEIRNTNFKNILDIEDIADEVIPCTMFGTSDDCIPVMVITILDEIFENHSINAVGDNERYVEEFENIYDNVKNFSEIPYWLLEDQVSIADAVESYIHSTFNTDTNSLPFTYNLDNIKETILACFKDGMDEIIHNLISNFYIYNGKNRNNRIDSINRGIMDLAFQTTYENVFSRISVELEEDGLVFLEGSDIYSNSDLDSQYADLLLKLTHTTMGYILLEFMYILKRLAPKLYDEIMNTIIVEVLSYRVYEVDPR